MKSRRIERELRALSSSGFWIARGPARSRALSRVHFRGAPCCGRPVSRTSLDVRGRPRGTPLRETAADRFGVRRLDAAFCRCRLDGTDRKRPTSLASLREGGVETTALHNDLQTGRDGGRPSIRNQSFCFAAAVVEIFRNVRNGGTSSVSSGSKVIRGPARWRALISVIPNTRSFRRTE